MEYDPWIFEGEWVNHRLSNELWLARECPQMFRDLDNPWTAYTHRVMREGGSFTHWQWQRFHPHPRANADIWWKRERVFMDILRAPNSQLRVETRAAICGWMLSNMLTTVPDYRPCEYEF